MGTLHDISGKLVIPTPEVSFEELKPQDIDNSVREQSRWPAFMIGMPVAAFVLTGLAAVIFGWASGTIEKAPKDRLTPAARVYMNQQ